MRVAPRAAARLHDGPPERLVARQVVPGQLAQDDRQGPLDGDAGAELEEVGEPAAVASRADVAGDQDAIAVAQEPPARPRRVLVDRHGRESRAEGALSSVSAVPWGTQRRRGDRAGRPAAAVEPLLDELLDARLLRAAGAGLEFSHALVREAVVAELSPLRRARLHRAAADALAARAGEAHLEEIAHHLYEAADERAADHLRRAGDRALAMLAYEEAAAHYARALEVAEEAARGPLHQARGDALARAGEPEAARDCFRAAAAAARAAGDPVRLARAALGHAGLGVTIIELDEEAIALLEEALEALGDAEPVLRSELLARLAVELYYAPARDRSEALSSQAVRVARDSGDGRALAAAIGARHVALWRPDRLEQRLAAAGEMIAVARAAREPLLELQGRNWRVVDLFEAGDMDGWRAEVRRHGELAARLRMPGFAWYTPLWAAVEAVHAGRYDEAAALAARAEEEGRRAGDRNADLFADMLRFAEVIQRGDWAALDLELVRAKIAGSPAGMAWRGSYAWVLAATGSGRRPRAAGDPRGRGLRGAALRRQLAVRDGECAEACALLGDPELAAMIHARLLPYAGRPLTSGRAITSMGSTQRLLAGLDAARWAAARRRSPATRRGSAATSGWAAPSGPSTAAAHSPHSGGRGVGARPWSRSTSPSRSATGTPRTAARSGSPATSSWSPAAGASSPATPPRWRRAARAWRAWRAPPPTTPRRSPPTRPPPAARWRCAATRATRTIRTPSRSTSPAGRSSAGCRARWRAEIAGELDRGVPWSAVVLRERRASPRDPRTGVTMLLAPAPAIVLRET